MTRVEVALLYGALRKQEMRRAAQQTLFLLPALQASGMLATGHKKGVGKAVDIFNKLKRDLEKIYGE